MISGSCILRLGTESASWGFVILVWNWPGYAYFGNSVFLSLQVLSFLIFLTGWELSDL